MRFIPWTLALIVGCGDGGLKARPEGQAPPSQTVDSGDTSEPVDTGDTAEEVDALCAGRARTLDVASAGEIWYGMGNTLPIVQLQTAHVYMTDIAEYMNLAETGACVAITTDETTGVTVYEGDCEVWGIMFSGRITGLMSGSLISITYEDVAVDDGMSAFTASGSWSYHGGDTEYFESDITISYDYGDGPEAWSLVTSANWNDEISEQQGWHEIIAAPPGRAQGAFCFDVVEQVSETCETGRDGSISVEGASDWVFAWGESEDCADCIGVTRDGVAEEPYCD